MAKPAKKSGSKGQTALIEKTKVGKPPLYAVLILNDDFTPMEFVVHVLMRFFQIEEAQAVRIMLNVHQKGQGVCGQYSREIAETKAKQVVEYASAHDYPLQAKIEPI